jgi:hypothetical protein
MNEQPNFDRDISEGEKASFRMDLDKQKEKIDALGLKTPAARLAALIVKKSGRGIFNKG